MKLRIHHLVVLILHAAGSFVNFLRVVEVLDVLKHHFLLGDAFVVGRGDLLRLTHVVHLVAWRADLSVVLHLIHAVEAVAVKVI